MHVVRIGLAGALHRLHSLRDDLARVQVSQSFMSIVEAFWDAFNHVRCLCLGGFDEDAAEVVLSLSQESIEARTRRRSSLASPVRVLLSASK